MPRRSKSDSGKLSGTMGLNDVLEDKDLRELFLASTSAWTDAHLDILHARRKYPGDLSRLAEQRGLDPLNIRMPKMPPGMMPLGLCIECSPTILGSWFMSGYERHQRHILIHRMGPIWTKMGRSNLTWLMSIPLEITDAFKAAFTTIMGQMCYLRLPSGSHEGCLSR
ncbi:hypothetical protein EJ06DRAFT_518117 [Trichodelitschia bisporula]|uniref:Uncharacterized protein n=1 Tax=Trichodelitschia bisporula TaxID=703511 RepID=A0A6G1IAI6_9PEZI|nr:hypothetical protein EJ06DRAFT_518117 [Trichodelitschia bisporula]